MNEHRVERIVRELRCDPTTQMFERLFTMDWRGGGAAGEAVRVVLFVVVLAVAGSGI